MAIKTLVNGIQTQNVVASDRGLHYGDGLFETLLISQQRPQQWDTHMARLLAGCQRLNIKPPAMSTLREEAHCLSQGQERSVLKIIITRGVGGRGYRALPPDNAPEATRIVQLHPYPDYPQHFWSEGITLRVCHTPLACHPQLAGIKHLNRLENILARSEWNDDRIPEGIMTNSSGNWIAGTMTNVFLVREGTLYTPNLSLCGIAGTMRQTVLQKATELGIPHRLAVIDHEFAMSASEMFVTNSLIGLWPVRKYEGKIYALGTIITQIRQSLLC